MADRISTGSASNRPDKPIVSALPPELKQYLEILRGLGWWPGTDLYLVLCGHAFDEEVVSMEVDVEASTSVGLNYFRRGTVQSEQATR